ncbi:MAG: GNAT family N-acetyltransferase [Anaerolineales bacterium]
MSEKIPGPAYRVLTPRLCIRCWQPSDAAQLKAAVDASREHLKPWMPWAHQETSLQDQIERLRQVRGEFDLGQDFVYGIFNRDESRVLGSTGLHTRRGSHAREIGYWIHVDHIGQGYATETAAALTRAAFEIEGMDRVEIHCDPANLGSAAIPRKLGYTHEATLRRRTHWSNGKVEDSMIWSLFAMDYPQSPAAQLEIQAFDAARRSISLPQQKESI